MEEQRNIPKSSHTNTVAAITFLVLGINQLWNMWKAVSAESAITVWTVAYLAMYVTYSLILFWGKQNKLLLIPVSVHICLQVRSLILAPNILSAFYALPPAFLMIILLSYQESVKKLWAIPGILGAIQPLCYLWRNRDTIQFIWQNYVYTGYLYESEKEIIAIITRNVAMNVIQAIGFLFLAMWIVYPAGLPKKKITAPETSNTEEGLKMKFCSHCGKEIMDAAVVCPHCGCAVGPVNNEPDIPSTGLNVLSLLIPLVGLILYLVYHDKAPNKAKAIGKFALIGVGIYVGLYILNIVLVSSVLSSMLY